VSLQLIGRHTVSNALAAIACACVAGVDQRAAAAALAKVEPVSGRLAVRRLGGITVIDDTYNANPGSLAAALTTLADLQLPGRVVIVVGDMLELGGDAAELHRAAGARLAAARPGLVLAVGEHGEHLVAGALESGLPAGILHGVRTTDEAAAFLAAELRGGDVVLLKASRGIALDRLVSRLVDVTARVA
jgi:UDP-N-acetylmuramoyl-tripeptide--D-alanyl-D-alanine ligase